MSVFKTTFSRALRAHPSDNANIPFPNAIESGTSTSVVASKLIDSTGLFVTNNVKTGDIVYNDTLETAATVVSVDSQTQLTLNADIFTATAQVFTVYAASPQTTIGNAGCFLYVGGTGNISVVTIGNDIATFFAVPAGTTLPIQVLKLRSTSTTATNIVALW